MKATYEKPTTHIILTAKTARFFSESGATQGYPLRPFLFNIVFEVLARATRYEREINNSQLGKEEVKSSLFTDTLILYVENQTNKKSHKIPVRTGFIPFRINSTKL